jgi:hypothetical protein
MKRPAWILQIEIYYNLILSPIFQQKQDPNNNTLFSHPNKVDVGCSNVICSSSAKQRRWRFPSIGYGFSPKGASYAKEYWLWFQSARFILVMAFAKARRFCMLTHTYFISTAYDSCDSCFIVAIKVY